MSNCLTTDNCLTIAWQLPKDHQSTAWLLLSDSKIALDDFLTTSWQLSNDWLPDKFWFLALVQWKCRCNFIKTLVSLFTVYVWCVPLSSSAKHWCLRWFHSIISRKKNWAKCILTMSTRTDFKHCARRLCYSCLNSNCLFSFNIFLFFFIFFTIKEHFYCSCTAQLLHMHFCKYAADQSYIYQVL